MIVMFAVLAERGVAAWVAGEISERGEDQRGEEAVTLTGEYRVRG